MPVPDVEPRRIFQIDEEVYHHTSHDHDTDDGIKLLSVTNPFESRPTHISAATIIPSGPSTIPDIVGVAPANGASPSVGGIHTVPTQYQVEDDIQPVPTGFQINNARIGGDFLQDPKTIKVQPADSLDLTGVDFIEDGSNSIKQALATTNLEVPVNEGAGNCGLSELIANLESGDGDINYLFSQYFSSVSTNISQPDEGMLQIPDEPRVPNLLSRRALLQLGSGVAAAAAFFPQDLLDPGKAGQSKQTEPTDHVLGTGVNSTEAHDDSPSAFNINLAYAQTAVFGAQLAYAIKTGKPMDGRSAAIANGALAARWSALMSHGDEKDRKAVAHELKMHLEGLAVLGIITTVADVAAGIKINTTRITGGDVVGNAERVFQNDSQFRDHLNTLGLSIDTLDEDVKSRRLGEQDPTHALSEEGVDISTHEFLSAIRPNKEASEIEWQAYRQVCLDLYSMLLGQQAGYDHGIAPFGTTYASVNTLNPLNNDIYILVAEAYRAHAIAEARLRGDSVSIISTTEAMRIADAFMQRKQRPDKVTAPNLNGAFIGDGDPPNFFVWKNNLPLGLLGIKTLATAQGAGAITGIIANMSAYPVFNHRVSRMITKAGQSDEAHSFAEVFANTTRRTNSIFTREYFRTGIKTAASVFTSLTHFGSDGEIVRARLREHFMSAQEKIRQGKELEIEDKEGVEAAVDAVLRSKAINVSLREKAKERLDLLLRTARLVGFPIDSSVEATAVDVEGQQRVLQAIDALSNAEPQSDIFIQAIEQLAEILAEGGHSFEPLYDLFTETDPSKISDVLVDRIGPLKEMFEGESYSHIRNLCQRIAHDLLHQGKHDAHGGHTEVETFDAPDFQDLLKNALGITILPDDGVIRIGTGEALSIESFLRSVNLHKFADAALDGIYSGVREGIGPWSPGAKEVAGTIGTQLPAGHAIETWGRPALARIESYRIQRGAVLGATSLGSGVADNVLAYIIASSMTHDLHRKRYGPDVYTKAPLLWIGSEMAAGLGAISGGAESRVGNGSALEQTGVEGYIDPDSLDPIIPEIKVRSVPINLLDSLDPEYALPAVVIANLVGHASIELAIQDANLQPVNEEKK